MTGEILAAGGGFLLAVLWFDLMFDVQALRAPRVASALLLGVPIALALARVFPQARRLAARADPPAEQSRLARGIAWAHVACFAALAAFLAIQLAS